MEKLTKENIQFIDNYLLKSGVFYKDIRVEMIDHVATAVEQRMETKQEGFYDAFKTYMVKNKRLLLENNLFTEKSSLKRFWLSYAKRIISLSSLILFLVTGIIMILVSRYDKALNTVTSVRHVVGFTIYIVALYYIMRVRIFTTFKYSALFYSFLFLYASDFTLKILVKFTVFSEFSGIISATIINFLLINFIVTTHSFLKYYKTKYALV